MSTEIADRSTDLAKLADLVEPINAEHRAFKAALTDALNRAHRAGDLLLKAKELCPHGTWESWLAKNFEGTDRTARRYMQISDRWPEIDAAQNGHVSDLSVRGALALLAGPTQDDDDDPEVLEDESEQDDLDTIESEDDFEPQAVANLDGGEAPELEEPDGEQELPASTSEPVPFDIAAATKKFLANLEAAIVQLPREHQLGAIENAFLFLKAWYEEGTDYWLERPDDGLTDHSLRLSVHY